MGTITHECYTATATYAENIPPPDQARIDRHVSDILFYARHLGYRGAADVVFTSDDHRSYRIEVPREVS